MACLGNEISPLRHALQVKTDTQKVENLVILNVVDTLTKKRRKKAGRDAPEKDPPFNCLHCLEEFKGQVFCLVVHVVW